MSEQPQNKKIGWRAGLIISCVAFVLCIAVIGAHLLIGRPSRGDIVSSAPNVDSSENLPDNPIDFATLQSTNPDTAAWIKIPGTIIDYPVMHSGKNGDGTDFYLNHNSDKKPHRAGAIYMQQINSADFSDPNTVLYGHNMGNGSMFSWLHQYKKKAFFDENHTILVYTPGHILTYEIYSAFYYDDRHILNSFDFSNEEYYGAFLRQTLNPTSMVKQVREGISVTTNARIITLSTCTGSDTQRLLVIGVLTDDQPTK